MSIITLTTDWNANDYYVGAVKGKLLTQCPTAVIVDISHQIQSFNIHQAAFVLRNAYSSFPEGTIHIIGVNTEGAHDQPFLLIKYENHYFVGTDNGIFGLLFVNEPEIIISVKTRDKIPPFSGISILTDTACKLLNGIQPDTLGSRITSYKKRIPIRAAFDESVINGSIIYIDSYKNVITNITRELFERVGKNRPFEIFVRSNHYKIDRINNFYNETSPGEILAIFNSIGLLEIAMNMGNVADLMDLSVNASIRVKFHNK